MILREGSKSEKVVELQERLKALEFYNGAIDGHFGQLTDRAVRVFQDARNIAVDGVVGPKTWAVLREFEEGEILEAKKLQPIHYVRASHMLGVEEAVVRSFVEVETRGSGFLRDGRPKILFERHWMYRLLSKKGVDVEHIVDGDNIINPEPGGYLGGAAEHDKLQRAKAIDPECAIQSASWGLGQLMGFHWQRLSFESVSAFESAMRASEAEQLFAMVRFLKTDSALLDAIRQKDWASVAKIYNGPNYHRNRYDVKMANAYFRWKGQLS